MNLFCIITEDNRSKRAMRFLRKIFFSSICFIDVASKIGSNKFVCAAENQRLEGILSGREKC